MKDEVLDHVSKTIRFESMGGVLIAKLTEWSSLLKLDFIRKCINGSNRRLRRLTKV